MVFEVYFPCAHNCNLVKISGEFSVCQFMVSTRSGNPAPRWLAQGDQSGQLYQ